MAHRFVTHEEMSREFGPCGRMYMSPEHLAFLRSVPERSVELVEASNPHAAKPTQGRQS